MAEGRPISFLSDYGYSDEFAGVCRAVISQIAPDAPIVDLSHGIGRESVRHGALALAHALPFCAPGVHLAVVDPGVGTTRRAVAVAVAEDRYLVGPDNGLLMPAIAKLGGPLEAVDIGQSPFRLEPVSMTFHGRDLFAPVAAHIALGATLAEAGTRIDHSTLVPLDLPEASVENGRIKASAMSVDHFGNVALDLTPAAAQAALSPGSRVAVRAPDGDFVARWAGTFADVSPGDLVLYEDSTGVLALASNGGNAAALLDIKPDSPVLLRPA